MYIISTLHICHYNGSLISHISPFFFGGQSAYITFCLVDFEHMEIVLTFVLSNKYDTAKSNGKYYNHTAYQVSDNQCCSKVSTELPCPPKEDIFICSEVVDSAVTADGWNVK